MHRGLKAATATLVLGLAACAELANLPIKLPEPTTGDDAAEQHAAFVLNRTTYEEIEGWGEDDLREGLATFLISCQRIVTGAGDRPFGDDPRMGTVAEWARICEDARDYAAGTQQAARYFIESRFEPYTVSGDGSREGLFTGYFEPELNGSWQPGGRFHVPLYTRPDDLIGANLGQFRQEWDGTNIAGRLLDDQYVPYYSRAEINAGALQGRGLELIWVDNPIDAFFLHIQGSGRIKLAGGGYVRVGYAGRNGHRYVPIGRELVAMGALSQEAVTMPSIRQWMDAHPLASADLMNRNPSYIFFRVLEEDSPVGAQGVPLTPGRSLAVDRRHVPYGVPIWLDTRDPRDQKRNTPLRRLMVAQDTGSAIKGGVRGDFFWGAGRMAAFAAGVMKEPGVYYLLLPKSARPKPALPDSQGG